MLLVILSLESRSFFDATADTTELKDQDFVDEQPIFINKNQVEDVYIVQNCTFTRCINEQGYGGAFRISISNGAQVSIISTSFSQCKSSNQGGAISANINDATSKLTIDGSCYFDQCSAGYGGAIFVSCYGQFILNAGLVINNCSSNRGGGIQVSVQQSGSALLDGITIKDCSSTQSGGGLYLSSLSTSDYINIAGDITFENCTSIQSGGGLYVVAPVKRVMEISANFLFKNCSSKQGGGIYIYCIQSGSKILMTGDSTCTNCSAIQQGGGAYLSSNLEGIIEVNEYKFKDCSSESGGAICTYIIGGTAILNGTEIENCSSIQSGGGIYIYSPDINSKVEIINSKIVNCSSNNGGGGIYCMIMVGNVSILGENLIQNCMSYQGGGFYASISNSLSNCFIDGLTLDSCTALHNESSTGGGMCFYISEGNFMGEHIIVNNCTGKQGGGGLYLSMSKSTSTILDSCEFYHCKSANGGGIHAQINCEEPSYFWIKDTIVHECSAIEDEQHDVPPSGYGGGVFLTVIGSYDYDAESSRGFQLNGMKIYNNSADKGGQSIYVAMTKVVEWCKLGIAGEYVKGNYSDYHSNLNELQGIPLNYQQFKSKNTQQINQQQEYLQNYWDASIKGSIWHVLNRLVGSTTGIDQYHCGNSDAPCESIEYALKQISIEKELSETGTTSEKRIGITENGFDLTTPLQLSQTISYTKVIKIMKQMYGTPSEMQGQAEIKIMKNNNNNKENGKLGWISALEGLQLHFYGLNIIMDNSQLLIPIIYIAGTDSILELYTTSFSGIKLSPSSEAKGIIHINVQQSKLIASDCLFENINISNKGGSAIRLVNNALSTIATLTNSQFKNITATGDNNGRGGSAL
ncbi:MAG: hypothetical protein EZS28_022313, partial [Streblomastix strix]